MKFSKGFGMPRNIPPVIGSRETVGLVYHETPGDNQSDYTVVGAAWTANGTNLVMPTDGGTNNSSNRLRRTAGDYGTHNFEKWTQIVTFQVNTIDGSSTGFMIGHEGIHSRGVISSFLARIDLSTGNVGKTHMYKGSLLMGNPLSSVDDDNTTVSITEGDPYHLWLRRNQRTWTVRIYDDNAGKLGTMLKEHEFTDDGQLIVGVSWVDHAPGHQVIMPHGGDIEVIDNQFYVDEYFAPDMIFWGHSIVNGVRVTDLVDRAANVVEASGYKVAVIAASGAEMHDIATCFDSMKEIIANGATHYIYCTLNNLFDNDTAIALDAELTALTDNIETVSGHGSIRITVDNAINARDMTTYEATLLAHKSNPLNEFQQTKEVATTNLDAAWNSGDNTHTNEAHHAAYAGRVITNFAL